MSSNLTIGSPEALPLEQEGLFCCRRCGIGVDAKVRDHENTRMEEFVPAADAASACSFRYD